jgi:uncharacterized protein YjbI with pentapeptide repeats
MGIENQQEYFCRIFNDIDLESRTIENSKFESCIFLSSNLSNTKFNHCYFINCLFSDCKLGNLLFTGTTFSGIRFY